MLETKKELILKLSTILEDGCGHARYNWGQGDSIFASYYLLPFGYQALYLLILTGDDQVYTFLYENDLKRFLSLKWNGFLLETFHL